MPASSMQGSSARTIDEKKVAVGVGQLANRLNFCFQCRGRSPMDCFHRKQRESIIYMYGCFSTRARAPVPRARAPGPGPRAPGPAPASSFPSPEMYRYKTYVPRLCTLLVRGYIYTYIYIYTCMCKYISGCPNAGQHVPTQRNTANWSGLR